MHENENILMPDEPSVDEISADESPEVEQVAEEEPKPKRTRRKKAEELPTEEPSDEASVESSEETGEIYTTDLTPEDYEEDMSLEDVPDEPTLPEIVGSEGEFIADAEPKGTAVHAVRDKTATRTNRPEPILTIEAGGEVITEEMLADIAWHEIHNAYRTRRILSGTFGGIEKTDNGKSIAVVEYKGFRIVIPLKEMRMELPNHITGYAYTEWLDQQHKILSNMLGAEIDFVVKGIDSKTRSVVASRRDAMLKKRQIFYMDPDANGEYRVREGRVAQARIISVADKSIRVELFGVETQIVAVDLANEWLGDAHDHFAVGDSVLVRIQKVTREDVEHITVKANVKSVSEEKESRLKLCKVQGKYAGKVTDVHKGVVYVRLTNGVNAIAHSCMDRRMPGKKDDVSFAVTFLDEERDIALGIITRIIKQNL